MGLVEAHGSLAGLDTGHIITVRGVGFRFDGTAEIVGGSISPELAADASAVTRALLADLRAMADQAEKRLAELGLLPDQGETSDG
ncbi:hypothetical protein GCM10017673_55710 [Streptosporangium violaceochromogenes]|nr:hypothetical protein GCM10017673_55710 [Streptosporangium violaceochromogenes]